MKQAFVLLLSFLLVIKGESQILKKIGNRIKDDAALRLTNKIDNEIRKGVDSIFEMPKKIRTKKMQTPVRLPQRRLIKTMLVTINRKI